MPRCTPSYTAIYPLPQNTCCERECRLFSRGYGVSRSWCPTPQAAPTRHSSSQVSDPSFDSLKKQVHTLHVPTVPELERMLRHTNLRVTRPRLAVLRELYTRPHSDTETIIQAIRASQLPSVSHQAVYDSLHCLVEAGLVRRIQPAGSVARYESRVGDNHHHIVCRTCGLISDVDCTADDAHCLTTSGDSEFATIDEIEVIYWGACHSCFTS